MQIHTKTSVQRYFTRGRIATVQKCPCCGDLDPVGLHESAYGLLNTNASIKKSVVPTHDSDRFIHFSTAHPCAQHRRRYHIVAGMLQPPHVA